MSDPEYTRDGEPVFDSACARRDFYQKNEIDRLRVLVKEAYIEGFEDSSWATWAEEGWETTDVYRKLDT